MYSDLRARWNGKRDGKRGIPGQEDKKHSDYVCQLLQAGEHNIKVVVKKFYDFMSKTEGKLTTVKSIADTGKADSLSYIGEDRIKDVIKRYYEYMRKNEGKLNTLRTSLDAKNSELDSKRKIIEQFKEKISLGKFGYWFIFIFIAFVEMPVNFMAFSIFESPAFTAILASGLSLTVPLMAHFLGAWFKEGRRGWDRAHVIKICVVLAITIAAIISIGYVREKLFETDEEITKIMDPTALTFVFVSINIFFFTAATVASKFAHYSDPEISVHLKEYNKLIKEGNGLSKRSDRVRSDIVNTAKGFRTKAEEEVDKATKNYNIVRSDVVNMAKKSMTEAEQILDSVQRVMDVYEQANMRARYEGFFKRVFNATVFWNREYLNKKEPERPSVFDNYPTIVIPPNFLKDVELIINEQQSPTVMIPQNFLNDLERVINEHQESKRRV